MCIAMVEWGDDDWAGQLRMAAAREAAGRPLSDLDHHARNRADRLAARAARAARLLPT